MKNITKADFLNSMNCTTLGWYTYNNTEKEVLTFAIENRIYIGHLIGEKAREKFIDGTMINGKTINDAIIVTRQLLSEKPNGVFFEAAFEHDGFVARADILIKTGDKYKIIEVKSATEQDITKSKGKPYVEDLAYTCWVAEKAGLKVDESSLYFLSGEYRLGDDVSKLFTEVYATEQVQALIPVYDSKAAFIKKTLLKTERSGPHLIPDCKSCGMKRECYMEFDGYTIYQIPGLQTKKPLEQGITRIEDYDYDKLKDLKKRVANCIVEDKIYIDKKGIKDTIAAWKYPIAYFDFETVAPPLPVIAGTQPYEKLPFQYSVHIAENEEQDITDYRHAEYLANPNNMPDSIMELAEYMVDDLEDCQTIVAYHDSFERGVVQWLADWAAKKGESELSEKLKALKEKFVDLKVLIRENYYDPKFKGSFSIKKTLPVLVPHLSYADLVVGNGDEATTIFLDMILGREEELEKKDMILPERKDMLEYCKLDTWAMVVLKKALEDLAR